ncbi:hypothetical protein SSBG_02319 [Streptomyces sp. SPB074]|nr:hypothetical protein SSBG_02319 [Streptomyces sp. SPB074]
MNPARDAGEVRAGACPPACAGPLVRVKRASPAPPVPLTTPLFRTGFGAFGQDRGSP